jgi:hypothetical protein
MAFDFKLNLSISSTPRFKNGERLRMSKWAEQAFEKVTDEENEKRRQADLDGQRRSQILAAAPYFWNELKETIHKEGFEFAKLKPGYLSVESVADPKKLYLRIGSPRGQMEIKFDEAVPVITFSIKPAIDSGFQFPDLDGSLTFEPTTGSGPGPGVVAKNKEGICDGTQGTAVYLLNMMI